VLLVLDRPTADGATEKSFRNLPMVRIAYAGGIGTYDVLLADHLVVTGAALDALAGEPAAESADGAGGEDA
jgi:ribosomal protein L4